MTTQIAHILTLCSAKTSEGNLSPEFLQQLKSLFNLSTFIETGTFMGDTTEIARQIYSHVESIELSEDLCAQANARFKLCPNVRVHQGDSTTVLPTLLPATAGRGLLWLDAHYSEGVTAKGEKNTPILEELQAIKNTGRSDFIVLIDDLRLFQPVTRDLPVDSSLHGYPSLVEIFEALLDIDPNYNFYVFGDVALAFVEDQNVRVSDVVRACTVSRVFDSPDFPVEDLLQAEQVIANAEGAERQELAALADRFAANETLGLGQHYRLWLGLLHYQQGASREAIHAFQRSIELGLDHWRVHYYLAQAAIAAGETELAESEAHIAQSMMPAQSDEMESQQPTPAPVIDSTGPSTLNQLINSGVWRSGEPLHLHLGCGEQYLDGYINIDYPQDAHNVMTVKADYYDNLMALKFPKGSVDEIRLHHVFEHFDRATALALLIRWQEWLKVGGVLHIETPDLMGCARTLLSDVSAKVKSGITRHLAGDQSAPWAYHLDLWYPERFEETFTKMGFSNVELQSWSWPHEPFLSNVNAVARKSQNLEREILIRAADDLLANSMVAASETPTLATWKEKLRIALDSETTQPPVNIPQIVTDQPAGQTGDPLPSLATKVPQDYLYDFNQRDRDQWVVEKANSIPAGSKILDVGAGTCPYRNLFAHCDYKTHDFTQYEGVKLGGDTHYGDIDYVSDIAQIPVPDNSFDVVLCTEVLEHVPEPIEALCEMSRILKPGGRLLVTAPQGSGLHQLPYHYYGGYTPEWYRTFGEKFGLGIQEITPNGGFFHLLAQECVRAAHLLPETDLIDKQGTEFVRGLLADWLPQYLFQVEDHRFVDQFTIGYHVEAVKLKEKADYKPPVQQGNTVPSFVNPVAPAVESNTVGVIFSKDRPLQLEATIASFKARCQDASTVEMAVLYTTTSADMEQLYSELAAQHSDVTFIYERSFKNDLISVLQAAKNVLFLVDDCVFVRDFAIQDYIAPLADNPMIIGSSLRLGHNTSYCYSMDRPQSIPVFETVSPGVNAFAWPSASYDFAYPLEVSSSVYKAELMLPLLTQLDYSNPNTLEAALASVAPQLAEVCKGLICPDTSIAFCIPVNKVQSTYDNRAGASDLESAEALAEKFQAGYRIDTEALLGFTPNACHQEIDLPLKKKSDSPRVSIVIPCYNQAEFLEDAIGSVVAQTFNEWECLIVNDGSTDSTAEVSRKLIEKFSGYNIRLVEQVNLGLSAARNTGIKESSAALILPLDADDMLAPGYLEETVSVLDQHPDFAIVYVDEQNFGIRDHVHVKGVSSLDALKNGNVHDYCSLYRKEVWETVGGYSPAMFLGGEDWNFWLAASKAGFRSYHLSKPLFHYRNREQSMVAMTLASIHEVFAHVIFHNPEVFSADHHQWAIEQLHNSPEENRQRARKYFAKHPQNPVLQELVSTMGLQVSPEASAPVAVQSSNTDNPLVSCIVPTMNRPDLLVRALESLVAQTYENWEAVVVNDAGSDVREIVENIDPMQRIKYVQHPENKGLSAARNTGIWASSGNLLCYLDDDDRFSAEHLSTLVSEMQQAGVDFIYSEATYVHEEVNNGVAREVERSTPYSGIDFSKNRLDITNFIPVNTWLHRRDLIEEVGFFDTELKALEDWDMLLRLCRVTEFLHLPKCTVEVFHRIDSNTSDHMLSRERKNIPELHRRLYYRYPAETVQVEKQRQALLASWGLDYDYGKAVLENTDQGAGENHSDLLEKALASEKLVGASLPALAKTIVTNSRPALKSEKKRGFYLEVCEHLAKAVDSIDDVKVSDSAFSDAQASLSLLTEVVDEDASDTEAQLQRAELRDQLNDIRYQDWIKNHALQEIDGQLFAERMMLQWRKKPSFHFVMFLLAGEEALLADSLDAIAGQMYPTWRLSVIAEIPCPDPLWEETASLDWVVCADEQDPYGIVNEVIDAVNADWIGFIEPGMTLEPQALLQFGDYINLRREWKLIYSDHDQIDAEGRRRAPEFKPDFNLDLARSMPYAGNAVLVNREVLKNLGGFSAFPELENHDLLLRVFDSYGDKSIGHIPDVLWHQPEASSRKPNDQLLAHVVQQHLDRSGIQALTTPGYLEGTLRIQYQRQITPKISIVIPSQNRAEFLDSCVTSVFEVSDYPDFEVIVAGAESEDPELLQVYDKLSSRYGDRFRTVSLGSEHSFSRLANAGVRQATGEFLLFLGGESEIVQPQWLSRMMDHSVRSEVGVVGARIIFPENSRINHAGVVLGREGSAGYVFREDWALKDTGYLARLQVDQNYSAVSGGGMMVGTELFNRVGGFAEVTFELNYADVDLCMKLSDLGLQHVWTPFATIVQHGNVDVKDDEFSKPERQLKMVGKWQRERAALLKAWLPRLAHDPAYNPNLDLSKGSFRVDNNLPRNWDTNFHDRVRVLGVPIKGGSGDYRIIQPFNALSDAGMQQCEHYRLGDSEKRSLSITEVARMKPDTVVVQAAIDDLQIKLIEDIAEYMPDVHRVCTLDDLVTDVPEKSSVYKNSMRYFRDSKSRMRRVLSQCNRLIVTTQSLADAYAELIDDIQVIPNRLTRAKWVGLESLRGQGSKPRVGWVGAQQHQGDLELVFDVVKALADEVEWVFMGMCPDEIKPYVKEYVEFVSIEKYPQTMASLNLDLAIAPLEVHPFNESKSNLRLLEYGAMGWPVVCTDIYSYRTNNAPVVRVPNETGAWVSAIRESLTNTAALAAAGDALKQWVLDYYILEDHLIEWERALTPKHLLGTVPVTPEMARSTG